MAINNSKYFGKTLNEVTQNVILIREMKGLVPGKALASLYGCDSSHIYGIQNGHMYKQIPFKTNAVKHSRNYK